jgi:tetratricopeptide (TPR) repeat protein
VLDQLHEIDPATLGVVAEALLEPACAAIAFITAPVGASVPPALAPSEQTVELLLPELKAQERLSLAETLLSLPPGSEIAQRVAWLGGDSAVGILEAARTLVSSGDLVRDGATFVWRSEPRRAGTVPVEALLTERVAGLSHHAYRLLELLCVAPPDPARDIVDEALSRDGLSNAEIMAGQSQLEAEGFVDAHLSLGHTDAVVRSALRNQMPPARAAELHRFVADGLRARLPLPSLASAQLAYHLAEGGQEPEAARALIDAARAAAEASFHRVALRLLAAAIELDGSADVRRDASETARGLDGLPHVGQGPRRTTSEQPARAESSSQLPPPASLADESIFAARAALLAGDHESVERYIDAAMAAGFGRSAAQRLLALSQLARGDVQDASRTLARGSLPNAAREVQARDALCHALFSLGEGQPERAVREALQALGDSRTQSDGTGELAALAVLSRCYRALGRPDDAERLSARATNLP